MIWLRKGSRYILGQKESVKNDYQGSQHHECFSPNWDEPFFVHRTVQVCSLTENCNIQTVLFLTHYGMIIFLKPCQQIQAADMILNDNLPPFFLICALLIDPIMVSYRCDQIWGKNLPSVGNISVTGKWNTARKLIFLKRCTHFKAEGHKTASLIATNLARNWRNSSASQTYGYSLHAKKICFVGCSISKISEWFIQSLQPTAITSLGQVHPTKPGSAFSYGYKCLFQTFCKSLFLY